MAVKFLTDEWAAAAQEAMNADEGFRGALGSNQGSLQQVVTSPEGDKKFYLKLADGAAQMAMGEDASADATISQDYETASAIWKNELSPVAAYMSGKIRVTGDLMKLMGLQSVLMQLPSALKSLDVEY